MAFAKSLSMIYDTSCFLYRCIYFLERKKEQYYLQYASFTGHVPSQEYTLNHKYFEHMKESPGIRNIGETFLIVIWIVSA